MVDPLVFLKNLQTSDPPVAVLLLGEEPFIRETVRRRIVEKWCGEEGSLSTERLIGTGGIPQIGGAMGAGSLFADKKVVILSDPEPGEKGSPLSGMGKNQLAELVAAIKAVPAGMNRLVIETGGMKTTSAAAKELAKVCETVDTASPTGAARKKWIALMAKKVGVSLEEDLSLSMAASSTPLQTLLLDMEKLSLAAEEGARATLDLWRDLSQSDPDATVWEIGDNLGGGNPGEALEKLATLKHQGMTIHEILPSLLTWNQQRLRVKSFQAGGGSGNPDGVHAFVAKKMAEQIRRRSLKDLRGEQKDLVYLDRCSKQSWEDPEILLEKFLVQVAVKGRK
jgi:DNA polymerase III delta subunit